MRKKICIIISIFLSVILIGCSKKKTEIETVSSHKETITERKNKVRKDTEALLEALIKGSDDSFKKTYGELYEHWIEDYAYKEAQSTIKEKDYTPADVYSSNWLKGYKTVTPTELEVNYFTIKASLYTNIRRYEITDIKLNKDKAIVKFKSRDLNERAFNNLTEDMFNNLFKDRFDTILKVNSENQNGADENKLKDLFKTFIFIHNYKGSFEGWFDVTPEQRWIPMTPEETEKTIILTKNNLDNWVISDDDFIDLMKTMSNPNYSEVYYREKPIENKNSNDTENKSNKGVMIE